ncbi:MAG: NAD(P)H-binding protein [Oleispira antarctica]|nr:NAD(P)H-binding protein [Oleispira antarctica]MBQ0793620.1 NAD(P)H-binding protein [Oleispira antarctica]
MTHKTALVIGATGLIGRHLVDELIASSRFTRVIALTRKPLLIDSTKFENHLVDFEQLENFATLFTADALFSCLGTTKKQVGSIEAQRRVDLDCQYRAAKIGREHGISEYFLVSSSGANANSPSEYLKMKGQLEEKILALDFPRSVIFRPSLLLGKRAEPRFGEDIAAKVMPLLKYIPFLNTYRPITGQQVAAKMAAVAEAEGKGKESYTLNQIFT